MTKHAAFLIFCLLLPISACSTDDWITQECATLPSDTSDLACQCHFHDLLKLASETHKTNKRVKITPRPATKHKSKSLETPQTSPNQSQADMQAQAGGFDFTNELPEAEPINTNSDSNTAKTSGMNELQAQADGFDFTDDLPVIEQINTNSDSNTAKTSGLNDLQAQADGFDFTNDLSDAEHIDARFDTNTAKTSGLNVLQAQADGFDFTNDSFDFTEHAAKSAFAVPPIPSPAQAAPTTGMTEQACIDINTADIPELMHLPGIGKSRAQAIVASREHLAFKRKKDIKRIKGIGNKSYLKLAAIICDIYKSGTLRCRPIVRPATYQRQYTPYSSVSHIASSSYISQTTVKSIPSIHICP